MSYARSLMKKSTRKVESYLLKPIRVCRARSEFSRPICCYEPEDVRILQTLAELQLKKHPDKIFIGRLSRGFDALGYQFSEEGLIGPSATAVHRFGARIAERCAQHESRESLLQYVTRWLSWQFWSTHTATGEVDPETDNQIKHKDNKNNETTQTQIYAAMEAHKTDCTCSSSA